MVINSNTAAEMTANNLAASTAALQKSLARLSSGMKIVNPGDDAAGLAVSSRLNSQITRLDAAQSNITNAVSFTQTQDGFMQTIDSAFRRMGELAMLSQDGTKSDTDRALYDGEFSQLKSYITATATKDFNSVSLFNGNGLPVTIDSAGDTFTMSGIDLSGSTYANAIAATISIANTTSALSALSLVLNAITQVAADRAQLGAMEARLSFTATQLTVTKENLSSAVSRIQDVDVAQESTDYARNQILVQSGTTMLAQANTLPQSTLKLLGG